MAYFTVAELRAQDSELANTVKFPDSRLETARVDAEEEIEHAADVAFVPRTASETVSGRGSPHIYASRYRVRAITAAVIDGAAVTDLSTIRVVGSRRLRRDAGWPWGDRNIELTYLHGYDQPPRRIKRAALILAKEWLLEGPITQRATQIATGDGGVTNLATPGVFGSIVGLPEVDAAIRFYSEPKGDSGI